MFVIEVTIVLCYFNLIHSFIFVVKLFSFVSIINYFALKKFTFVVVAKFFLTIKI